MTPAWSDPDVTGYIGDCREVMRSLPERSVHCVVTSPPYYGLRKYAGLPASTWGGSAECEHEWGESGSKRNRWGLDINVSEKQASNRGNAFEVRTGSHCSRCNAWRGHLGLEPNIPQYIANMLEVFAEIWRVLRDDGTVWLDIGDSYASSPVGRFNGGSPLLAGRDLEGHAGSASIDKAALGLPPKNLLLMPFRVALALQDAGWIVRADCAWVKKSSMPESATDRPTRSWEHIFLLVKRGRYYYDADAVREPHIRLWDPRTNGGSLTGDTGWVEAAQASTHQDYPREPNPAGANQRDSWILGPEPSRLEHYAAFVSGIPRRAILAGTSERGVCPEPGCGAPWRREVLVSGGTIGAGWTDHAADLEAGMSQPMPTLNAATGYTRETLGWSPTCKHGLEPAQAVVLDPFGGSGTTSVVARQLGRRSIYIDASPKYVAMARKRIAAQTPALLTAASVTAPAEQARMTI